MCKLSSRMHDIPLPEILNYSALFEEFDETLINHFLSQINPFNVIIVMSSSSPVDNCIQEKYLGGKYSVLNLPERRTSALKFSPLVPNKFIPIDTSLVKRTSDQSILCPIQLTPNVMFLYEDSFRVCKGGIEIRIYSGEDQPFFEFYS